MLAPVTHILPLTTIHRERVLQIPGKVIVRKGQKVNASDTIAEARLDSEHLLLDISRSLGVSSKQVDKYIKCVAGDALAEGDLVAGPVGMARRVVRSPVNGQVLLAGSGQVLIEAAGQPFQLKAGLSGEIADLISDRGAIVETTGALIQGVWGNGRIDSGLMTVLLKSPDESLTPDQLDVSLRGAIALAAHCGDPEVLKTAEELPLRGLILSTISANLVKLALLMHYPIIVLDGFGQRPMNSTAYKLLTTNERHDVSINAEPWDRYAGTRPEVVIPLPAPGTPALPRDTDVFSPDQQVRVLRAPYANMIGSITALKGQVVFPNGLHLQAAEVRLESGESVLVPLANLEVLL
ncbi:MAG: hypothetical protein JXB15_14275 [Anaerolineales bacterium]|nr:hypothetical protein [Anaerolineales bacterium]